MVKTPTSTFSHTNDDCDHISSGFEKKRVKKGLFFIVKIPLSNQHDLLLGKGSNNQNGNLRWHLP